MGLGVTVFVVCGCVPIGEALGSGVTVAVGWGVVVTWLIVAVGCGPAGMLGLGRGVVESLGDCAAAVSTVTKPKRKTDSIFIAAMEEHTACQRAQ